MKISNIIITLILFSSVAYCETTAESSGFQDSTIQRIERIDTLVSVNKPSNTTIVDSVTLVENDFHTSVSSSMVFTQAGLTVYLNAYITNYFHNDVTVESVKIYNGEGQLRAQSSDPDLLNGNHLDYEEDIGISLTTNVSSIEGYTVHWHCVYDGLSFVVISFVGTENESNPDIVGMNQNPVITVTGERTLQEGDAIQLHLSAIDGDNDSLSYDIDGIPQGGTFNNNAFSWMPSYEQAGEYNIVFQVSDYSTTISDTVQVTVVDTNRPPEISSQPDTTGIVNETITISLNASDDDGDELTYTLLDFPEGMSISAEGVISWTPDDSALGIHEISVQVADDRGGNDNTYFSLTIEELLAPNLTFPSESLLFAGQTVDITWEFVDQSTAKTTAQASEVNIYLSIDSGDNWEEIQTGIDAALGMYSWEIPDIESEECLLKIEDVNNPDIFDINDQPFTIRRIYPVSDVTVHDTMLDQVYQLSLSWNPSPDENEGLIENYRIYRSRSDIVTDPIHLDQITNTDSLSYYEEHYTILVDSVTTGTTEYIDVSVQGDGASYYYWIEAVGSTATSEMVMTSIITSVSEHQSAFNLGNAYPNPFNPATTIAFSLPQKSHVKLSIYNVTGQEIALLENGILNSGSYSVVWNAGSLPAGLYLYKLEAGGFTESKKMLLLR